MTLDCAFCLDPIMAGEEAVGIYRGLAHRECWEEACKQSDAISRGDEYDYQKTQEFDPCQ